MPRRPAPTPLLLFKGPLPPRSESKFTMPSVPRPIFLPPFVVTRGPAPRQRVHSTAATKSVQESPAGSGVSVGKIRGPWDHTKSYTIAAAKTATVVMPPKAAVGIL
jgi:hypothetical protein